ncbi:ribosome maturation factor RimP, partial [Acidithiobacillus caldus]
LPPRKSVTARHLLPQKPRALTPSWRTGLGLFFDDDIRMIRQKSGPSAHFLFLEGHGLEERLLEGIAEQAAAMGCGVVDVRLLRVGRSVTLQVFIEKDEGAVTIEDCAAVSRQLSVWLDVENPIAGAYRLEVSSPGLDRPLKREADFQRFVGALAEIELRGLRDGRRRWRGRLLLASPGSVALDVDGVRQEFLLAEILKAKLVPEW